MSPDLTAERLRSLLDYSPETGVFTRRVTTSSNAQAGNVAGFCDSHGYWQIRVDKNRYPSHRLAFLWMTGSWPVNDVDHINGMPGDNRWENLREATTSENMRNAGKWAGNTSGWKGVSRDGPGWRVQVVLHGKRHNFGTYSCPVVASWMYDIKAREMHGEFFRGNHASWAAVFGDEFDDRHEELRGE